MHTAPKRFLKQPRVLIENGRPQNGDRLSAPPAALDVRLAVAVAANGAATVEAALQAALAQVCASTGWPVGHAYLLGPDGALTPTSVWSLADPGRFAPLRAAPVPPLAPGVGLPGRVLASGTPAWALDLSEETAWPVATLAHALGLRAAVACPITVGQEVLGVLVFFAAGGGAPAAAMGALLTDIGAQLGWVVSRAQDREALQRSELYFRHLTENALEFITVLNRDGTIRYESPYVELTLGYLREDYVGKSAFDFVHSEDLPHVLAAFTACLQTPGVTPPLTFRFRHSDGSWRVLEGLGTNLLADPAVAGIVFNSRDVTERARAEGALRESEEFNRRILESSNDCIQVLDLEGRLIYISASGQRLLEICDVTPILGTLWAEFWEGADRRAAIESVARAKLGGIGAFQGCCSTRSGDLKWWDVVVTPMTEEDGKVERLLSVSRDITERKRAEAALHASEMRFRSVVETAKDAIVSADCDGKIISWNPGAEAIFGYAADEVLGKPLDLLMPERHRDAHQKGLQRFGSTGESRVIGRTVELHGVRKDGGEFPLELSLATWKTPQGAFFSGIIRDITERKAFEEQLLRKAFYDALTNLPNRALFMNRLEHALARGRRYNRPIAVLMLDLDRFKVVNDSLGHVLGDRALITVGQRLQAALRPEDTVARFGGDEFVILLDDIADLSDAIRVAERIAEQFQAPQPLEGHDLFISASVGIAFSKSDDDRPDDLLRAADLAMYEAKNKGRARYAVFDPSMSERAHQRLKLESDLRRGIERREFRVHYQPSVTLGTGRVSEVEALARWEHPQRGLLAPTDFIPLAEETALIVPIGQWVLQEACRQAMAWRMQYSSGPPLVMSVNLSARQFQHVGLVDDITRTLAETGLEPAGLKLEITESVVIEDEEAALAILRRLKALGVQLAIDDFGAGYSSLRYLKLFPIDSLKIDKTFIDRLGRDAADTAIVRAMITVSKTLDLIVAAEGIETAEQLGYLRAMGCDQGQGYYFARPLTSKAVTALLASDRRW